MATYLVRGAILKGVICFFGIFTSQGLHWVQLSLMNDTGWWTGSYLKFVGAVLCCGLMDWERWERGWGKVWKEQGEVVKMPPVIMFQIKKPRWAHQGVWFNPTMRMWKEVPRIGRKLHENTAGKEFRAESLSASPSGCLVLYTVFTSSPHSFQQTCPNKLTFLNG